MLLVAFAITLLVALLINACLPLRSLLENLITVPILMMAQIVLITQILSIFHALNATGYWIGHLIILGGSVALWYRCRRPSLLVKWSGELAALRASLSEHPLLALFATTTVMFVGYRAWSGVVNEDYFLDALIYHIPRALFWLQNGTAEHFFTQNFRLVEFPPNGSFVYTWIIALSGQTLGLNLLQAFAMLVSMLVTIGLAHQAEFSWRASVFAGCLLPYALEAGQHISGADVDLAVAALTNAAILFVIAAFHARHHGATWRDNTAIFYFAVAFGLALGTKYTALFMLPGAVALSLYGFYLLGHRMVVMLAACAMASIMGFAVFGSYNYVLNLHAFGHPLTSQETVNSSDLVNNGVVPPEAFATLRDPLSNTTRYLYQMLGVEYFQSFIAFHVEETKIRVFESIFSDGLNIAYTDIGEQSVYPFLSRRTYLLIFPIALYSSIAALVVHVWRSRRSQRDALLAAYIACSWSYIMALSSLAVWSGVRMRFFVVIIPLIFASMIPPVVGPWRLRTVLLMLTIAVVIYSAILQIIVPRTNYEALTMYVHEQIRPLVEDGETLGLMATQAPLYHIMSRLPEVHYQFVPANSLQASLQTNKVDVVIAQADYCAWQNDGIERELLDPPMWLLFSCVYKIGG